MKHSDRHYTPTDRDLVALADESLPAARRVRVQRAVAASPALQASVAAQHRALTAVALAGSESAPTALRARLALAHPPRRARVPRLALRAFGPAAVALATVSIVAVLVVGSGPAGQPSVAQAAVLATRAPLAPAPSHHGDSALLHGLRAAGLPYPYWEDRFGFKAVGVRRDRIDGRTATTVFYTHAGRRLAYTIISGRPLAVNSATHTTLSPATRLRSFSQHGRIVVTWLRRGHSCVLSGANIPLSTLLRLAAWTGGGEIPY